MRPLALILILATLVTAQAPRRPMPTAKSAKLAEVKVIGAQRFKDADIIAATELKLGQLVDDPTLQHAADNLALSGMFMQVSWRAMYTVLGARVEFRVQENEEYVPPIFDNFIWLSDTELHKRIARRVPLYRGIVPMAGEGPERVRDAIAAELHDLGISATVTYENLIETDGIHSVLYTVEDVRMPVVSVEITGAPDRLTPELQKKSVRFTQTNYAASRLRIFAAVELLPELRSRGYVQARFDDPETTPRPSATSDVFPVAVRLPLIPGPQFKIGGFRWSGQATFTEEQLAGSLHLAPGDIANLVQLDTDLLAVGKIYGTRGYLDAKVTPTLAFDASAGTVSFDLKVEEGEQYRFTEVRMIGLDDTSLAKLRNIWKLRSGEVFDSSYPALFLQAAAREFNVSPFRVAVQNTPNRADKTVEVTLTFSPRE